MRTTLDLDSSVLEQLKEQQRVQNKSLGQLASELLAIAMTDNARQMEPPPFTWSTQPMRARVDIEDKERVQQILDDKEV